MYRQMPESDLRIAAPIHKPQRIASLSPGITETLYALGVGEKIAGVTSFCSWPPDASSKPKIAGFQEVSLEALARVKPDLAVLPDDMARLSGQIERLGIPVFIFEGRTLNGYLRDLPKLAEICGAEDAAQELAEAFESAMIRGKASQDVYRPTVLFAILTPDDCARPITEINVLGKDGFYNELIEAAGGTNAYRGEIPYPRLSREAILALDPDIILISAPHWHDQEGLLKNWQKTGRLKAAERNFLRILTDPGDTVPGPRSIHTLNEIAALVRACQLSEAGKR